MTLYGTVPANKAKSGAISAPMKKTLGLKWNHSSRFTSLDPYFSKSSSKELVISQLTQLLLTDKGERVMYPDFGTSIKNLLFEPLTDSLVSLAAQEIELAIKNYVPSITLLKITMTQDENMYGYGLPGIKVALLFRLNPSSEVLNLKVNI